MSDNIYLFSALRVLFAVIFAFYAAAAMVAVAVWPEIRGALWLAVIVLWGLVLVLSLTELREDRKWTNEQP